MFTKLTKSEEPKKIAIEQLIDAAQGLKSLTREVKYLISTLNPVELVTPVNLQEEKKAWIKDAKKQIFRNPTLKYDTEKLRIVSKKAEKLKDFRMTLLYRQPDSTNLAKKFLWDALFIALSDGIQTADLAYAMLKQDDAEAGRILATKYGLSDSSTVSLARSRADEILYTKTLYPSYQPKWYPNEDSLLLEKSELRAYEIRRMFNWMMEQYNAEKWPVEILTDCSAIDVRDKSSKGHPIIAIPKDRKVNGWGLAELLGHEIECHWRSSINAELIGVLKCDDELVYEGLAMRKDLYFNQTYLGIQKEPLPYYVLTESLALRSQSFADTASQIYHWLPDNTKNRATKAWNYTYRSFRGISDTNNPKGYAFTKDRAYFEGFKYANELEMRGLDAYLSFSTLKKELLERLIAMTDLEDIKRRPILTDQRLQQKAIEKMVHCLRYGHARSYELMEIKPESTALRVQAPA